VIDAANADVYTEHRRRDFILGLFGVLLFQKYINRISENTTQRINHWTVRIGAPFTAIAYLNVVVAMVLYFS
jgi:hypothetical protein